MGLLRGAVFGAIYGVIYLIKVFEFSPLLYESGIGCILYLAWWKMLMLLWRVFCSVCLLVLLITNNNKSFIDQLNWLHRKSHSIIFWTFRTSRLGEIFWSLPQYHNIFHLPCINTWLLISGSCLMCRRDL